jgi:hypothetical protein
MRVFDGRGGGSVMARRVARSRRWIVQFFFHGHDQFGEYQCPMMLEKREGMERIRVLVNLVI